MLDHCYCTGGREGFLRCKNQLLGWPTSDETKEYAKFHTCGKLYIYRVLFGINVILTEMFLKGKIRRLSSNQLNLRVTQNASLITYYYEKKLFCVFGTFRNPFHIS